MACSSVYRMARRNPFSALWLSCVALCMPATAQVVPSGDTGAAQLSSIVQHMTEAQAQAKSAAAYRVIRQYRLLDTSSSRVNSEVVAQIDYLPPGQKSYVIQSRTGSGRGEQVVKRVLDHESQMSARNPQSSASTLSEQNYTFTYLGADTLDGTDCYVLGLFPRRKEKELVVGRAWIDKNTFLIRRIEGEMAKSPSWLLKKVQVKLDFTDISGVWLQTGMEAVADVRFVGSQTLQSKTLEYRSASEVAQLSPGARKTIRRNLPAEILLHLHPGSIRR